MPERFLAVWNNMEYIIMTAVSFFGLFIFSNILSVIAPLLAIIWWLPKIKKDQVDKDHGGSWIKWILSFPKFFKHDKNN